jgi:hypothetical protein
LTTRAQICVNLEEFIWRAHGNFEEHKVLSVPKFLNIIALLLLLLLLLLMHTVFNA